MVNNNSISDALNMSSLTEEDYITMINNYNNDLLRASKHGPADPDGKWLKQWKLNNNPYFLGKSLAENHKLKKSNSMKLYYNSDDGIEKKSRLSAEYKLRGIKPPTNKHTKGTTWWNDGKINVRSTDKPTGNFVPGRLSWVNKKHAIQR